MLAGSGTRMFQCDRFKVLGEVAERPKALDWNSSYIFTGVRGFESHPLRQNKNARFLPGVSIFGVG